MIIYQKKSDIEIELILTLLCVLNTSSPDMTFQGGVSILTAL